MPVCVHSEIGPLKKVLLHRPGAELEISLISPPPARNMISLQSF